METINTFDFSHDGNQYRATVYRDLDMGAPWKEHDGHGVIRSVSRRDPKRPGEKMIGNGYAYDVQATIKLATRDKWGVGDDVKATMRVSLGREPTAAEVVAWAVDMDLQRMQAWVKGDWFWIGVDVSALSTDSDGDTVDLGDRTASLWGFESDSPAYIKEVSRELAEQIESAKVGA